MSVPRHEGSVLLDDSTGRRCLFVAIPVVRVLAKESGTITAFVTLTARASRPTGAHHALLALGSGACATFAFRTSAGTGRCA
ncbi:hypothetical protein KGA66_22035 [Actinocrinis puniceicyclus]|uniref:Uncharacterized protein n=1 Tax=Actinocrinis puniceicyclus TaxID=977794 RepID=A0A8J7WQP9_9ACTN|nr:hypothetical protein [Actinocrinis puniceicyclus]MBS2965748.1 hypothetical protein [Actinocrinis puniceicyclus]